MLAEVLESTQDNGEIQRTGSDSTSQPPLMALAASVASSGIPAKSEEVRFPSVPYALRVATSTAT